MLGQGSVIKSNTATIVVVIVAIFLGVAGGFVLHDKLEWKGEAITNALPYYSAVVIAGLAISLQVLDFFGLLSLPGWKERVPGMCVMLSAMTLIGVSVEHRDTLLRIDKKLEAGEVAGFKTIGDKLDPVMKTVMGEHVQLSVDRILSAIEEKKIDLGNNPPLFRRIYKEVLTDHYPEAKLNATSLPSAEYFWTEEAIQQQKDFIDGGGSVERVFFVNSTDLNSTSAAYQVMAKHCEAGVTVYTVQKTAHKLFLYDTAERFGWEVAIALSEENKLEISGATFVTSDKEIKKYAQLWDELHDEESITAFKTDKHACGHPTIVFDSVSATPQP